MSKENEINIAEVTPESLMNHFKGSGVAKMIIVTIVFHVVLVFGTSVPYLKKMLVGDSVAALSKEQRIEKAVSEATSSLKKIALENGLNPQDISDNFSPAASRAAKAAAAAPAAGTAAPSTNAVVEKPAVPKTDKPESQIEKDLKKTVKGPTVPPAAGTDDIF